MLVSKIVLTGGPCGGKTTALSTMEQELTDMGYKVYILDEVATRLISAGIKPFGDDKLDVLTFEDIMLKHQLLMERSLEEVCKHSNKKCIILCDRGIFDIRSFLSDKDFNQLLVKNGISPLEAMDQYDIVIDLVSAAKGASKYYTLENNEARTEGLKEAIERENLAQASWSFHNNLVIIDNSTSFDEKIIRCMNAVKNHLGLEKRSQRKFLIEVDKQAFQELNKVLSIQIEQTYLENNYQEPYEFRLRKRTLNNENTYYVTVKRKENGKEEIVTEEKIEEDTYQKLLFQRRIEGRIKKERSCFTFDNHFYKLDHFEDGMIMLETDKDVTLPSFVAVLEEVTLDNNYNNVNLATRKQMQKALKFKKISTISN